MLRRREEHGEEPPPAGPRRTRMRQRLVSISNDYDIEDDQGRQAFASTARRCACDRR